MNNRAQPQHSIAYQKSEILGLTPVQLLIKVYDFAIIGCRSKDADKVCRALVELISSLRFEYQEVSVGLFRLYQFCMDDVKQGKFENAEKILISLRDTWKEVSGSQDTGQPAKSITINNNA